MGSTPPVTPEEGTEEGVQYTELDKTDHTVGVLFDPDNSDAWLQSTLVVPPKN